MHAHIRLLTMAVIAAAAVMSLGAPAAARGGPPNIINSEGYQRALREERKLYAPAQPVVPVVAPRRRHHRHHD